MLVARISMVVMLAAMCKCLDLSSIVKHAQKPPIHPVLLSDGCQQFETNHSQTTFDLFDLSVSDDSSNYTFLIYVSSKFNLEDQDEWRVYLSNEKFWFNEQLRWPQEAAYTMIFNNKGAFIRRADKELKRINHRDFLIHPKNNRAVHGLVFNINPVQGLIEVQNLGDIRPFMSFIDKNPISVKYISFESSKPINYFFNCPPTDDEWIAGSLTASATYLTKIHESNETSMMSPPVTEVCLGCICEVFTNCNRRLACNGDGDVCGLFRITRAYWADSGKPTQPNDGPDSRNAFSNCVNEPICAAKAVQGYMAKFGQDCNGDGVINCSDHVAIHLHGGYDCRNPLPENYQYKLDNCIHQAAAVSVENTDH